MKHKKSKKSSRISALQLIGHLEPGHEGTRLIDDVWVLHRRLGEDVGILRPFLGVQTLKADVEVHQIIEGDLVEHLRLERAAARGQHGLRHLEPLPINTPLVVDL